MSQPQNARTTTIDTFLRAAAAVDAVDPALALTVGTVLDDGYELRERLAAGGMATVFRAFDRRLSREVAIKVPRLLGDRERTLEMFEREAQATARLSHPNIVALHHIGDHRGTRFAVLELLHGETLAARLARRHVLPTPEAMAILDGVLEALGYAHERGIVHRDLTPRNVFLTTDQRVKLLDFGVAIEHGSSVGTATRAAGTPGYMAPEHMDAADPRNDLWAAGVLFLECVTGQRPQAGGAQEVPGELPRRVREMVARAVDRDPDNRPSTASDMRVALAPGIRPARPCARRRWRRAIVPAALACVAAAVIVCIAVAMTCASSGLLIPCDGRWRGDPPAGTPWETELQRIDDSHFSYKNVNHLDGRATGGTLLLEKLSDGTTILSGKIADLPTCPTCINVGFIEFIVLDETHIYQNRSAWGPSHDNYKQWFPEYRYKWEGRRRDVPE
ncbi:MAG TPA: serine/threonine-protein kinase [Kofleriaceae bacterium]|nr:serine/threonine-protein kinase [Kofleriaceae bacterium]